MSLRAACLSHVPKVAVVGVRAIKGGFARKHAWPCDVAAPWVVRGLLVRKAEHRQQRHDERGGPTVEAEAQPVVPRAHAKSHTFGGDAQVLEKAHASVAVFPQVLDHICDARKHVDHRVVVGDAWVR